MTEKIRNFSIIAHIDHGKSTLADRFLEITGAISKDKISPQYLDQLELERERGITIKLAPVTMRYNRPRLHRATPVSLARYKIRNPKSELQNKSQIPNSKSQKSLEFRASDLEFESSEYILNLIDTPGHVDFSYEVSRSLACVEGALLLVDATKGIEAQTLSNYFLAKTQNLEVIPVINKIDLPNAQVEETKEQIANSFGFDKKEILKVSAKTGNGVGEVLETLIEKIPNPKMGQPGILRALVFDFFYYQF